MYVTSRFNGIISFCEVMLLSWHSNKMPHLVWLTVSEYGAADSEMIGDKKTSCWI
jgi:hypothetical protein